MFLVVALLLILGMLKITSGMRLDSAALFLELI